MRDSGRLDRVEVPQLLWCFWWTCASLTSQLMTQKVSDSDADSLNQWVLCSASEVSRSRTQSKDCGQPEVVSWVCKPRAIGSEQVETRLNLRQDGKGYFVFFVGFCPPPTSFLGWWSALINKCLCSSISLFEVMKSCRYRPKKVIVWGDPDHHSVQYPSCLAALSEWISHKHRFVFCSFFSLINEGKWVICYLAVLLGTW